MARPLPAGDYDTFVSRGEARPNAEVYAWSVRDVLSRVPVPLLEPDPDVPLDLELACTQTYKSGRYDDVIDYAAPLTVPLAPEDRVWAEGLARSWASSGPRQSS
jgi:Protein of unknown function (DUF4058)